MLTQGGDHAERDIPAAISRAAKAFPNASFVYAWPFASGAVVGLRADQARRFTG